MKKLYFCVLFNIFLACAIFTDDFSEEELYEMEYNTALRYAKTNRLTEAESVIVDLIDTLSSQDENGKKKYAQLLTAAEKLKKNLELQDKTISSFQETLEKLQERLERYEKIKYSGFIDFVKEKIKSIIPEEALKELRFLEEDLKGEEFQESLKKAYLITRYPELVAEFENIKIVDSVIELEILLDKYFDSALKDEEVYQRIEQHFKKLKKEIFLAVVKDSTPIVNTADKFEVGKNEGSIKIPPTNDEIKYYYYIPEEYNPQIKYPVLVTYHGTGGEGSGYLEGWRRVFANENIIMISPTAIDKYRMKGWSHTIEEKSTMPALVQEIKKRYNIDTRRIFYTGYSMGGHAAWNTALVFPTDVTGIIPMAGAPFLPRAKNSRRDEELASNLKLVFVYAIYGDSDKEGTYNGITGACRRAKPLLEKFKTQMKWIEQKNTGHILNLNNKHYEYAANLIVLKEKNVCPPSFSHYFREKSKKQVYWTEILEVEFPKVTGLYEGKMTTMEDRFGYIKAEAKGNSFKVTTKCIKKLRIFFPDKLLDLGKPVKVYLNNSKVFDKKITPDLKFMLRKIYEFNDPEQIYWGCYEGAGK